MDGEIPPLFLNCEIVGDSLDLPEPQATDRDTMVMIAFTLWAVGELVKVTKYSGHIPKVTEYSGHIPIPGIPMCSGECLLRSSQNCPVKWE